MIQNRNASSEVVLLVAGWAPWLIGSVAVEEEHFLTFGCSIEGRMPIVSQTDRGNRNRIISALLVNQREKKMYEEG